MQNLSKPWYQLSFVGLMLASLAVALTTSPARAEPVELSLWIFLDPDGTDPRGHALKRVVDSFNAKHSDVNVKVNSVHWAKIDSLAIQATAAGKGPDLLNIYTNQLAMHVGAETIRPLTSYAEPWLKRMDTEYAFPIAATTFGDQIMAVPWELRVFLLWYRKDALEEAGLALPATLDEVAVMGGKLREAFGEQSVGFAVGLSEKQYGAQFAETFFPILWANGGRVFDDQGKAAFHGDAGVEAMRWFRDAVHKHKVIGREGVTMGIDEITSGVRAGTVFMTVGGSMRVAAARTGVGGNLATAPLPGLTADKPAPGLIAGQTMAIGKNTKHPDKAWIFIEHFLSKESQLEFASASVMPVLASAYDDPTIASTSQGPELKMWMEYVRDHGMMERLPEDYTQLAEKMAKAAQQIVYNDAPIRETLAKVAKDYNAGH